MVVVYLIIVALLIWLQWIIAGLFSDVATAKGHTDTTIAWRLCFWLGIVGYLYVIALPNNNLERLLENSSGATQSAVVPPNSWKCKTCGRINANYVGTCACGTDK